MKRTGEGKTLSQYSRQSDVLESGAKGGGWFRWFKPKPFKGASGKHPKTERGKLTESQHRRQQEQIEAIKSKHGGGNIRGRTGIVNKSESLKKQKVVKQKKKKVNDLDPKEQRKYEALRKKQADQKALNQVLNPLSLLLVFYFQQDLGLTY